MSARLVLVGEGPNRTARDLSGRPSEALTGRAGRFLCDVAGWDWTTYLRRTDRRNLFQTYQERWDRFDAALAAIGLWPRIIGDAPIILLGRRVAEAFGVGDQKPYVWITDVDDPSIALVPHPSGLNRVWNDPAERTRARAFLEPLL